jgi:hypothetical protein
MNTKRNDIMSHFIPRSIIEYLDDEVMDLNINSRSEWVRNIISIKFKKLKYVVDRLEQMGYKDHSLKIITFNLSKDTTNEMKDLINSNKGEAHLYTSFCEIVRDFMIDGLYDEFKRKEKNGTKVIEKPIEKIKEPETITIGDKTYNVRRAN